MRPVFLTLYGGALTKEAPVGLRKRFGMVIGIKPDRIAEYRALHADSYAGVRDLLSRAHMRNFSIFIAGMPDGKPYLFGYYEYDGENYDADMAKLAAEPRNKEWLAVTDSMQIPLPGQSSWKVIDEVYHND